MIELFNTIVYKPLYNVFIYLLGVVPGAEVGFAIIILTIVVRGALLPLSHKSVSSQAKMKTIEPEVKKIKEIHAKDPQEQARQIMALYKKHGISPFSGCLSLFIQLPIVIGLFFVFYKGLKDIKPDLLYSFVTAPESLNMHLFTIDLAAKSAVLAVIAGVTQYFQMKLSLPSLPKRDASQTLTFKEEFGRSMSMQMRYVLPGIVFFVALSMPGAVSLYWATSNTFSVLHELFVKKKAHEIAPEVN